MTSCTERWIQVRSEPPGATVYLDGRKVGTTPCETRFTWYGQRELVLEKDGFQPHSGLVMLKAPFWQWPIIDLIADFLLPWTFTDRHTFSFPLEVRKVDPKERVRIRERAEEFKKKLEQEP